MKPCSPGFSVVVPLSGGFPDIANVFQICTAIAGLKDLAEGFGPIRNRHSLNE